MWSGLDNNESRELGIPLDRLLDNHLISTEVFGCLGLCDLLVTSLVSKDLYGRARTYMLRNRICLVRSFFNEACHQLEHFHEFLASSPSSAILPFNGLQFRSNYDYYATCLKSHEGFHAREKPYCFSHFPLLFSRLTLKYVEIFPEPHRCPIVATCLEELSRTNFNSLETVKIQIHVYYSPCYWLLKKLDFLRRLMKANSVGSIPKLRTLILKPFPGEPADCFNPWTLKISVEILTFLREFAPNLRMIRGYLPEELLQDYELIPKHKYKLRMNCYRSVQKSVGLQRLLAESAQLNSIYLHSRLLQDNSWDPACFCHLLRNIGSSLKRLSCSMSELQFLSRQACFPLFRLKTLKLYSGTLSYERVFACLPVFDFPRMFPALEKVELWPVQSGERYYRCSSGIPADDPVDHPCFSVSRLEIFPWNYDGSERLPLMGLNPECLETIMRVFPAVQDLSISRTLLTDAADLSMETCIPWKLTKLNFLVTCLKRELWEETFSCLHSGLRTLNIYIDEDVLEGANESSWKRDDGYFIPFITPDLALTISKHHPGLVINLRSFFPIWPTLKPLMQVAQVEQLMETVYRLKFGGSCSAQR